MEGKPLGEDSALCSMSAANIGTKRKGQVRMTFAVTAFYTGTSRKNQAKFGGSFWGKSNPRGLFAPSDRRNPHGTGTVLFKHTSIIILTKSWLDTCV